MPQRPPTTWIRRRGIDFWYPAAVIVVVGLFGALSLSGSSLGVWSSSGKPATSDIVTGEARPIRSDEWLASSPLKLGRVRADFPATRSFGMGTPDLSDSWRPQLPSRSIPAALYSPFNLPLVLLPMGPGFALTWWLPFAACLLGSFAWLRLMGVRKGVALAASVLITASPVVAWWSGWAAQSMALAMIPCALIIAATRLFAARRWVGVVVAVAAGLSAAGLPWWYQPWGIPTALFTAGVTVLWGLSVAERRRAFVITAVIASAVFALESAVYLLHERDYYTALANTAYPGERRELGGDVRLGMLASSLFPFTLTGSNGLGLRGANLSEISMGWTVAAPIALAVAALGRRALLASRERILLIGAVVLTAVIGSWTIIRWPSLAGKASLLTFSPPTRVAPFLGFFGVVSLALMLGSEDRIRRLDRQLGWSGAAVIGVGTLVLTWWGATEFRSTYFPTLSDHVIYLTVFVLSVAAALLVTRWWRIALGVLAALAVVSSLQVNPLMHGLGKLEDSAAAKRVRALDASIVGPAHGAWAADSVAANGLLNGQGVNSLSSFNDPVDEKGWHVLDPHNRAELAWNRYGYIVFDWQPKLADVQMGAPVADQVYVFIDPCNAKLDRLHLKLLLSSRTLSGADCLASRGTIRWQGTNYHVYERT